MLDYANTACTTSTPVDKRVVAFFRCTTNSCNATSPTGYAQYQKLVIRFADKTRESTPFTHRGNGDLRNAFTVTVRENDLLVTEDASRL